MCIGNVFRAGKTGCTNLEIAVNVEKEITQKNRKKPH